MSQTGERPANPPSTLSPLPPPPVDRPGGYRWAIGMIATVAGVVLLVSAYGWLTLPGFGPTAGAGWWLYTVLLVVAPAGVLLATLSCAGVAVLRRAGARRWPAPLQALPPVVVTLGLVALFVLSFMFTDW